MLIPRVYYRIGDKAVCKTEAGALIEANRQIKEAKGTILMDVFKCVRMEHDESSMENAKEDSTEWRVDDVIEFKPQLAVTWT